LFIIVEEYYKNEEAAVPTVNFKMRFSALPLLLGEKRSVFMLISWQAA